MANKKGLSFIEIMSVVVGILLLWALIEMFTLGERMQAACEEHDMTYVDRGGDYCLTEYAVLHPVVIKCDGVILPGCKATLVKFSEAPI